MLDYTSIMVLAYSRATGKSVTEALAELAIDHLIEPAEIGQPSLEEELLISSLGYDKAGVAVWAEFFRRDHQ